jgi:hypothetical protein
MSERIERPAGVFARKTARHLRIANASIKTIGWWKPQKQKAKSV